MLRQFQFTFDNETVKKGISSSADPCKTSGETERGDREFLEETREEKRMKKGELIGEGRTAEIYSWGQNKVLKLYMDWCNPGWIEYEEEITRICFEAGLPALEAAKGIDLGPYADWGQPERLIFNVERAYRELRGDPWDTPVNAVELFRAAYELRLHIEASRP